MVLMLVEDDDLDTRVRVYADRFGNTIRPGDFLIYGRSEGRCATTGLARLVRVVPEKGGHTLRQDPWRRVKLVLDSLQNDQGWSLKPHIRRVTIREPERVLLYATELVSPEILAMYAAFEAASTPTEAA